ncbi:MAG: carboxypeptidase-like regulatory domain-containing protein [bacterium]|nr:carboxypeptidase-like regulatory domain-containing protein [bacterium]
MKKIYLLTIIGILLITASVSAANEEKSYILSFANDPTAGTALNPQFAIPLPAEITIINAPDNAAFSDSILYLIGPETIIPGSSWDIEITISGPAEILDNLNNKELAYGWQDENFIGEGRVVLMMVGQPNFIQTLRSNVQILSQIKKVGVPLAIGLGGVGVISLGITAVSTSASLAFNLAEFLRYLAFGFLRFKKRKPWGTVHNEITSSPVAGALVKIFDTKTQKLKETQLTDKDGRFGFLVQPGDYYIKTSRHGFIENQSDVFKVVESEVMTDINVPLLPLAADTKTTAAVWHAIKHFITTISPYVLALGSILSAAIAIIVPSKVNIGILIIYVVIDIIKIIISIQTIRPFGLVEDQKTDKTLDLAVVRIFDLQKNWLLNTKVTDLDGKFDFLVMPGSYYLTAARDGYQPFHSKAIKITESGLINLDIKLAGEK